MNEIIESVKNLSIGFNSQKGKQISILRNVSTNIKKGETVGIVGESGSGKSTLALAMMGYIKQGLIPVSYTHLRDHETPDHLVLPRED